jgi:hypothetical protein
MFEERAEKALDPISRQHYREMAARPSFAVGRVFNANEREWVK